MKKEIKESWEKVLRFPLKTVEKGIDEEGWYSNERNDAWLPILPQDIHLYEYRNDNTEIRPKCLTTPIN